MYVQHNSTLQSYNQNIPRKGIYYKKTIYEHVYVFMSQLTFHTDLAEFLSYGSYELEFAYLFFSQFMFIVFKIHDY